MSMKKQWFIVILISVVGCIHSKTICTNNFYGALELSASDWAVGSLIGGMAGYVNVIKERKSGWLNLLDAEDVSH